VVTRSLRIGDKVCREDDPRHSGRLEAIDNQTRRGRVIWYPSHLIEYLDLDDLVLAAPFRRRTEAENEALIRAYRRTRR
jgi:hypothetical protein